MVDAVHGALNPPQPKVPSINIDAITLDVKAPYFDFHVPTTHCYEALGIWHHNSGKSTASREIAKRLNMRLLEEPVDEELLELFYNDSDRWAFPFQMEMLHRRWALQMSAASETLIRSGYKGAILDRCILGDLVFARAMYESGKMHKKEWEIYLSAVENMHLVLFPPTLLVYLNARPETCLQRIQQRNRPQEKDITLEYLQLIHAGYQRLLQDAKVCCFPWSHAMESLVIPWDPTTVTSQDWDRTASMLEEYCHMRRGIR
jgi:deoxyadenosine/deoxycytidine kinase